MFALAIIEIISGTLTEFVRSKIEKLKDLKKKIKNLESKLKLIMQIFTINYKIMKIMV